MPRHADLTAVGTEIHLEGERSKIAGFSEDPTGGVTVSLVDMPDHGAAPARAFAMPLELLVAVVAATGAVVVPPGDVRGRDEAA